LLQLGCVERESPTTARRLDHDIEKAKTPEEKVRLLREAQQRFGKDVPKKEEPTLQQPGEGQPIFIFPRNDAAPLFLPEDKR
jgi:hypothetical protein